MCARTPVPCTVCGENLYWRPGLRTTCLNGHTGQIASIPVPAGHNLTSQYHGNGMSHVMLRTLCNHCRPL